MSRIATRWFGAMLVGGLIVGCGVRPGDPTGEKPPTSDLSDLIDLEGRVYHDTDGNSAFDTQDPGLAGLPVYVDLNDSNTPDYGEPSAITVADDLETDENELGTFLLSGLEPGSYVLNVLLNPGWKKTYLEISEENFYQIGVTEEVTPDILGEDNCNDEIDNDNDGNMDCKDTECITNEVCVDEDGDGVVKAEDCNDADKDIYPGADEFCGGDVDYNCDDEIVGACDFVVGNFLAAGWGNPNHLIGYKCPYTTTAIGYNYTDPKTWPFEEYTSYATGTHQITKVQTRLGGNAPGARTPSCSVWGKNVVSGSVPIKIQVYVNDALQKEFNVNLTHNIYSNYVNDVTGSNLTFATKAGDKVRIDLKHQDGGNYPNGCSGHLIIKRN